MVRGRAGGARRHDNRCSGGGWLGVARVGTVGAGVCVLGVQARGGHGVWDTPAQRRCVGGRGPGGCAAVVGEGVEGPGVWGTGEMGAGQVLSG